MSRKTSKSGAARTWTAVGLLMLLLTGCGSGGGDTAPQESDPQAEATDAAETPLQFVDETSRLRPVPAYENGETAGRNSIVESLGGGVGLVDFDVDGRLDVCFPGGGLFEGNSLVGLPTSLLRQTANGTFENVSGISRIDAAGYYSHGCSVADYDADGFADVLITGYGGLELWRNLGDGTFERAAETAGLIDPSWSSSAAWGDLDGDGHLDLYVAHYVNWSFENDPACYGPGGKRDVCAPRDFDGLDDTVFLSNGDGTFRDGSEEVGLVPEGKGLGVLLADLDHNGALDAYVANDTTNNFLYLNDGSGQLEERGVLSGTAVDALANANGSMGLVLTDFNLDGRSDLWVANYEDENFALYRNDGGGNFLYFSTQAELNLLGTLFVAFGCVPGDFDLDGDEDVAVANGHVVHIPRNAPLRQQPLMMVNDAGDRFERVMPAGSDYFEQQHPGRGLATGDLNGNGLLDLVFTNIREAPALLLNESQVAGESLQLRLVGRASNRTAIGARIELKTPAGTLLRHVVGGGSYLSSSDRTLHFGIPEGATVEEAVIHWSGGHVDRVGVDALTSESQHRLLVIVEGRDDEPAEIVELPRVR
ncbi:FG-GAP repeat protein [Maioricimonas rarisocia]|uniref:FG-GAP repeat protein n=1 Tax=Maioricimonas rarisocia TaxID=2528026 RepID=A0A517Z686_9PLAN|nr:CRTAC1 family protein [Maioricimonas rarisocia]QDU37974.1 FG-GAP repeat protein [Maioricimonas rarisocia]